MLSRFTWRWEIADVMFHITQVVDLLAEAEKKGGFALAVDCLKSMGRNYKESNSHGTSIAQVTAPCPKYDFDFCLQQPEHGQCLVQIFGGERYAGFGFTCGLPPATIRAILEPDLVFGVSWRAQKLLAAIQEDALKARHS